MPAPTQSPQSQAIANVNLIISTAIQLMNMFETIQMIDQVWTDDAIATTIGQWQTVAVNLDGSLATTSDVTITNTHPFNPALYPTLTRPVSSTQVVQAKSILDGIVNYVSGQAVTTQPGARAILNAVIGG